MGGDWHVVRGLGLLILTVVAIGGLWIMGMIAWLHYPRFEVSFMFVFVPWAVMATVGMTLLWAFTAIATFFRVRKTRRR